MVAYKPWENIDNHVATEILEKVALQQYLIKGYVDPSLKQLWLVKNITNLRRI